jgi:secreted trypsin-like serine protease
MVKAMRARGPICALLLLLAGCSPTVAGVGEHGIVGGSVTAGYPEVVAVLHDSTFVCSGVVVAPRIVLTAAHCVYGLPDDGDGVTVRFGPDANAPDGERDATALRIHPDYGTQATHDVALIDLVADAPVTPVPWNTEPLELTLIGQPVTLVGYGQTGADDASGEHQRRETSVVLSDLNATALRWQDGAHGICEGDSGGPAIMDLGGGDVVVGVLSEGDPACEQWGAAVRTDAMDGWLADPIGDDDDDDDFTQPEPSPPGSGDCGSGQSLAIIGLLAPIGLLRRRS